MSRILLITPLAGPANSSALQFPFLAWRKDILARGLDIRLQLTPCKPEELPDSSIIALDSRSFASGYGFDLPAKEFYWLDVLRRKCDKLVWFDTSDSSGTINPGALELCNLYLKHQALADRSLYEKPLYGLRLHSDFAYRQYGITDDEPICSKPLIPSQAKKIGVFWNSFAQNFGPWARYIKKLRRLWPAPSLHRFSSFERPVDAPRPNDLFARMSKNYARATISWQRKETLRRIAAPSNPLSHRAYMREMAKSRAVLSPFGWGEINLRDYETFMAGAALVKPSMDHIETWPNFWKPEDSYLPLAWDFSDFDDVIEQVRKDNDLTRKIAKTGQQIWRHYTTGPAAKDQFIDRIVSVFQGTT